MGVALGSFSASKLRQYTPRADPFVCAFGMLSSAPFLFFSLFLSRYNTAATWVSLSRTLLLQLLYADDLAVIAETEEELIKRLNEWKENVESTLLLQPFNGLFSRTTWVRRYQKGKTNLDFTGARDGEWQWYQLGHMQVCTSLQTDNHASTPPLCFLQAGCTSCRPINSVKALKALCLVHHGSEMFLQ